MILLLLLQKLSFYQIVSVSIHIRINDRYHIYQNRYLAIYHFIDLSLINLKMITKLILNHF